MFCKTCGTLYNPKDGQCPKCSTRGMECDVPPAEMSDAEARRLRKRSWIQLVIGIPAFIGFIYLLVYLVKLFNS
ncbi:MAG: hypothetical protein RR232_04940 [Clostridia bacterium]